MGERGCAAACQIAHHGLIPGQIVQKWVWVGSFIDLY